MRSRLSRMATIARTTLATLATTLIVSVTVDTGTGVPVRRLRCHRRISGPTTKTALTNGTRPAGERRIRTPQPCFVSQKILSI